MHTGVRADRRGSYQAQLMSQILATAAGRRSAKTFVRPRSAKPGIGGQVSAHPALARASRRSRRTVVHREAHDAHGSLIPLR